MYQSFFKLRLKPFDLLSNPDFLFLGKHHRKALAYLDYALQERAGFMLLTGEVGSGKTTLINELLRKHRDGLALARIFYTNVTSDQLLAMVANDFGLSEKTLDKAALLRALNGFLIEQYALGNRPLLVIDEAQNLTPEALEEVRMLSNLESDSGKLLQIIFVGQPELRRKLAAPGLLQLRQRISFSCHLPPLTLEEVGEYIAHRLEVAGNREAVVFSRESLELIGRHSRGIPRLINIICDFLLLAAFAEEKREISSAFVMEVAAEIDFEGQFWGNPDIPAGPPPSTPLSSPDRGPGMRGMLDSIGEFSSRLDDIEGQCEGSRKMLIDMDTRLKKFERPEPRFVLAETAEDNMSLNGVSLAGTPAPPDPSAPDEGEKKAGFLRKIFRAI